MNAVLERVPVAQTAQSAPAPSELDRLLNLERSSAFSTRDLLAGNMLDKVLQLAEVMASGKVTCPKHLQGNVGDCAAIIGQAMRWGMDHNAVAQKTHLVNGVLGYEAQLVIAVLNSSPLLVTRLDFRWPEGWAGLNGKADNSEAHWVEVWATLRGEAKPRLLKVTMAQVGNVRNSPNWASDARQQLAYLAAKRWGRLHAPDVVMGVYTPDELQFGQSDETPPPNQATAPAPRPGLEPYPAERFAKNLPLWRDLVSTGKQTPADILGMVSSKATLSDEQERAIKALTPVQTAPGPDPDTGEIPPPHGEHADFIADMEHPE